MSKILIKGEIQSQFPDNNDNLILPENVRSIADMTVDESLNVKDGGFDVEQQTGYKTEIALTDPKAWITKKYAEDNFTTPSDLITKQDRVSGIVYGCVTTKETIDGNGVLNDLRTAEGRWYNASLAAEFHNDGAGNTDFLNIALCLNGGDLRYVDIVGTSLGTIIKKRRGGKYIPSSSYSIKFGGSFIFNAGIRFGTRRAYRIKRKYHFRQRNSTRQDLVK